MLLETTNLCRIFGLWEDKKLVRMDFWKFWLMNAVRSFNEENIGYLRGKLWMSSLIWILGFSKTMLGTFLRDIISDGRMRIDINYDGADWKLQQL